MVAFPAHTTVQLGELVPRRWGGRCFQCSV